MTVSDMPKAERDKWAQMVQPYCDSLFEKIAG